MGARSAAASFVVLGVLLASAPTAAAKSFEVTRTGDGDPGMCDSACTLREAVKAANAKAGSDTIRLGPKTYKLTRSGFGEDASETGDLDILGPTTIVGAGATKTTIDGRSGAQADRLIDVPSGGSDPALTLKGLTLHDGLASTGAAVNYAAIGRFRLTNVRVISVDSQFGAIESYGIATLRRVVFRRNESDCCPAVYNDGVMSMRDVVFDRNRAMNDTGAFYSSGTKAVLNRVTFSHNRSGTVGGGAMISSAGINRLSNVTFSGNEATGNGGALYVQAPITLNNVTFTKNVADSDNNGFGDGGGIHLAGSNATLTNTILAGNVDRGGEADECSAGVGALVSGGFNLFGSGSFGCVFALGPGDIPLASGGPGLIKLRSNGGFAPSHALKGTSKAKNKGSSAAPGGASPACEGRDQRGVKRPQRGRCDIGAFELK